MTEEPVALHISIIRTIIAAVVALVVYLIVSVVASPVINFIQRFFGELGANWAKFFAAVMTGALAPYAARYVLDYTLKSYYHKVVFFVLVVPTTLLLAWGTYFYVTNSPHTELIFLYAQILPTLFVCYALFWRIDDLDK